MQYWYNNNGQQDGPYSLNQIKSLNLPPSTLVFKTGEAEWKMKSVFPELSHHYPPRPPQPQPQPFPPRTIDTNNAINLNYIKTPYNWWLWLLIASILPLIFGFVGFMNQSEIPAIIGIGIALLLLIASGICGYILMYRNWKIIQDGNVRTTPGKAVGFCFIPLFNLYWIFQAIYGLSIDQEGYIEDRNISSHIRPNKGIALATCIIALIPYVNFVTPILTIITYTNQKNVSLEILKNK